MLAVLAGLVLGLTPAAAQNPDPGLRQEPGTASASDDVAAQYEQVQLLVTISALNLTPQQLGRLQELNSEVMEQAQELAQVRAQVWEEHQADFEAVLEAWLAGRAIPPRAKQEADAAVQRVNAAQASVQNAAAVAAEKFLRELSEEQAALVESQQAAAERAARAQRMGGVDSVGKYVATEMDAIRDLMPDEFAMLARAEATRVARAIVGPESAAIPDVTALLLDIFRQVRAWTPQQYQAQRQQLPADVEAALGITSTASPAVAWSDLVHLVSSAQTAAVIALLQGGGGEGQ